MKNKARLALFVNWTTQGRDIEIDLPLMYFFEKVLGWQVEHVSMFNFPKIFKIAPDIVIMCNTNGGARHVQTAKLIKQHKIPLFSHVSEGMFKENDIEECVWGWAKNKKIMHEDLCMYWSKHAYSLAKKYYPETSNLIKVSGYVGIDKYKILAKQEDFKLDGNRKIVGYAAFDFHNIESKKEAIISKSGLQFYERRIQHAIHVNKILHKLAIMNPSIDFIIKRHPGDGLYALPKEADGLAKFSNVKILPRTTSIMDAIDMSDIWLNYNSGSNLEAWLLNKPSITLHTDEEMFSSDIMYGSFYTDDLNEVQACIDEYYQTSQIQQFDQRQKYRNNLIEKYVGFSDGFNHVRFMSHIRTHIERIEASPKRNFAWKIGFFQRLKSMLQYHLYKISKGHFNNRLLKPWAHYFDGYSEQNLLNLKTNYYREMDEFYKNNQKHIMSIYKSFTS